MVATWSSVWIESAITVTVEDGGCSYETGGLESSSPSITFSANEYSPATLSSEHTYSTDLGTLRS